MPGAVESHDTVDADLAAKLFQQGPVVVADLAVCGRQPAESEQVLDLLAVVAELHRVDRHVRRRERRRRLGREVGAPRRAPGLAPIQRRAAGEALRRAAEIAALEARQAEVE